MGLWRRLLLIPSGFILAMTFNVCRMSFLTIIAAKKGVAAIAQYHDPAGILVALVCTVGLWCLAMLFNRKLKSEMPKAKIADQTLSDGGQWSEVRKEKSMPREMSAPNPPARRPTSVFFVLRSLCSFGWSWWKSGSSRGTAGTRLDCQKVCRGPWNGRGATRRFRRCL